MSNNILEKGQSEDNLKYFIKNLSCFEKVIRKLLTLEETQLSKDPKFIEKIIDVWICIILHRDYLLKKYPEELKNFAAVTPRLIQYSTTSYSNTFLIHPYLKNQKVIDKFRRNFKHILREKMMALRP